MRRLPKHCKNCGLVTPQFQKHCKNCGFVMLALPKHRKNNGFAMPQLVGVGEPSLPTLSQDQSYY